jgi:hypothetical protein
MLHVITLLHHPLVKVRDTSSSRTGPSFLNFPCNPQVDYKNTGNNRYFSLNWNSNSFFYFLCDCKAVTEEQLEFLCSWDAATEGFYSLWRIQIHS